MRRTSNSHSPNPLLPDYRVVAIIYDSLMENENKEAIENPDFMEQLDAHFSLLSARSCSYFVASVIYVIS